MRNGACQGIGPAESGGWGENPGAGQEQHWTELGRDLGTNIWQGLEGSGADIARRAPAELGRRISSHILPGQGKGTREPTNQVNQPTEPTKRLNQPPNQPTNQTKKPTQPTNQPTYFEALGAYSGVAQTAKNEKKEHSQKAQRFLLKPCRHSGFKESLWR